MDFSQLDYQRYCLENRIHELFGIEEIDDRAFDKRINKPYENVDPNNTTPFPPELDDLIQLHYFVHQRKATTVLEFGAGKSTRVLASLMRKHQEEFASFVRQHLRRLNAFQVHSVETGAEWIETCKRDFPPELLEFVTFHHSPVKMTTFNGRACTLFEQLPNICPDFIYLDGPGLHCVTNDVHGISTAHADRLPMSADLAFIEPFLLPGTFILIDGRAANARFLKNNFQREWKYTHYDREDIHTFELVEPPLGVYNERQLKFCLGEDWIGFRNR